MPETVLERHYRDRVQSVRQIASHEAGHESLSWRNFEALVALCLELSMAGRQLLEKEYQQIFREPDITVTFLQERRRVLEELSDNNLQLAESVKASAYRAWHAAGSPPGTDIVIGLEGAIRAVAEAKQRVLARWPVGNDDEIAQAQAAAGRHEGLDLDEAFAQIAGVDVTTWRQRVAEYKEQRSE
jgi:hypothetical protein